MWFSPALPGSFFSSPPCSVITTFPEDRCTAQGLTKETVSTESEKLAWGCPRSRGLQSFLRGSLRTGRYFIIIIIKLDPYRSSLQYVKIHLLLHKVGSGWGGEDGERE